MLPFGWLISSSLKDPGYFFTFPPQWTPVPLDRVASGEAWADFLRPENFVDVFMGTVTFGRYMGNSAAISALAVAGTVLSSSLVGYSFARLTLARPRRTVHHRSCHDDAAKPSDDHSHFHNL